MYISIFNYRFLSRIIQLAWSFMKLGCKLLYYGYSDVFIEKLVTHIEDAGPIFIKLAQWLCQRPDLVSNQITKAFTKFQTYSKESDPVLIQKELDQIKHLVDDIVMIPLGIGSIAQVHKAKLKNGNDVIIKIIHPELFKYIDVDLTIIYWIFKLFPCGMFCPEQLVDNIRTQTNLINEANNLERFRFIFRNDRGLTLPDIIYKSPNILVESYISGIHINELKNINKDLYINSRVQLIDVLVKMIKHKFIHTDLHDGNILYNLETNKIGIIDYGMVMNISDKESILFSELIKVSYILYQTGTIDKLVIILNKLYTKPLSPAQIQHLQTLCVPHKCAPGKYELNKRIFSNFNQMISVTQDNKIKCNNNIIFIILMINLIEANITEEYSYDFDGKIYEKYLYA